MRPSRRFGRGQEALPDVQKTHPESGSGLEALLEVEERVGRPSRRSGSGR